MPRPRLPPTPSSSTDIVANDQVLATGMERVFSLPPPAMNSALTKVTNRTTSNHQQTGQSSPPLSPAHREVEPTLQRKRTLSGTRKSRTQPPSPSTQSSETILPPPPSRARKIIQMKPKQSHVKKSENLTQTISKPVMTSKEAPMASPSNARGKRAQSSATSAAGRKIARKTAHSIIERRRRSKMNEEFGVLKDMIPACAGVEMHKLAILQAGIEYVKYLEGCIEQLKSRNESPLPIKFSPDQTGPRDEDEDEDEDEPMDVDNEVRENSEGLDIASTAAGVSGITSPATMTLPSCSQYQQNLPSLRRSSVATSTSNSTFPSPDLHPVKSSASLLSSSAHHLTSSQMLPPTSTIHTQSIYSTTPPPSVTQTPMQTGVSPAFGAIQFSPDLSRTSTWSSVNGYKVQNKPSPSILPLPQSAMPLPLHQQIGLHGYITYSGQHKAGSNDGNAEAAATAALIMMTKDRRNSSGLTRTVPGKGMSVKDLLSS